MERMASSRASGAIVASGTPVKASVRVESGLAFSARSMMGSSHGTNASGRQPPFLFLLASSFLRMNLSRARR